MIVGAVLFAAALFASAHFLKDRKAGDWSDAALYIGLACFLLSQMFLAIIGPRKHAD